MNAYSGLCGVAAAVVLAGAAVAIVGIPAEAAHERAAPVRHETPWLTDAAAAQIIGPHGALGPLFDGIELGARAPSPEVRARIAAFTAANRVAIALDVDRDTDTVAGIRFDVTFGGCCGYEGVDMLALRIDRPASGVCYVCGPDHGYDAWSQQVDAAIMMTAEVDTNRLRVHWQPVLSPAEMLATADALIGEPLANAIAAAPYAWSAPDADGVRFYDLPYGLGGPWTWRDRDVFALAIETQAARISSVTFDVRDSDPHPLRQALRARWGSPRIPPDGATWTWWTATHQIEAVVWDGGAHVTISRRQPR